MMTQLNEKNFKAIELAAEHKKGGGSGEIGLDYYWIKESAGAGESCYWFKRQLELAKEKNLPVIHSRMPQRIPCRSLKETPMREMPAVIHCYPYSVEMARIFKDGLRYRSRRCADV